MRGSQSGYFYFLLFTLVLICANGISFTTTAAIPGSYNNQHRCSDTCVSLQGICTNHITRINSQDSNGCHSQYTQCLLSSCSALAFLQPYNYSLNAMQFSTGATRINWSINPEGLIGALLYLPTSVIAVRIRRFNSNLQQSWDVVYRNIPLTRVGNSATGSVDIESPTFSRHEWIQVLIQLYYKDILLDLLPIVLSGYTQVLYYPDLVISDSILPIIAYPNQMVNIKADITEK